MHQEKHDALLHLGLAALISNKIIYFQLGWTENNCDGATTGAAAAAQPSDLQFRVPQFEHIITSSRRGTNMPQF